MPIKTITLVKIAALGGFALISTAIGMKYIIIKRFQKTEYYQKSVRIVLENKKLLELLGEPVKFGNPELGNNSVNYSTPTEARFVVPIEGRNKKGLLHLYATRGEEVNDAAAFRNSHSGQDEMHGKKIISDGSYESGNSEALHWMINKLELSLNSSPERKIDLVALAIASQKEKSIAV